MFFPKAMLIHSLCVSFRLSCHLKENENPAWIRGTAGEIQFSFILEVGCSDIKKAGWEKNAPGGKRLVDYEINGRRVGEDLLSPVIHSHYTAASGGL